MNTVKVLAFGIAKDIVGGTSAEINMPSGKTSVAALKTALMEKYPAFSDLKSLAIAVNEEYANDQTLIQATDEVVLIPPVSGG